MSETVAATILQASAKHAVPCVSDSLGDKPTALANVESRKLSLDHDSPDVTLVFARFVPMSFGWARAEMLFGGGGGYKKQEQAQVFYQRAQAVRRVRGEGEGTTHSPR